MLYVLQYLSVLCAFLLPWGVIGAYEAKKAGNTGKFKKYLALALGTLAVVGLTVGLAFALD